MWHMVYRVQAHHHHSAQRLRTPEQNFQLPNRLIGLSIGWRLTSLALILIVVLISLMMQVLHATVTMLYYASNTIKQKKTQFKSK